MIGIHFATKRERWIHELERLWEFVREGAVAAAVIYIVFMW